MSDQSGNSPPEKQVSLQGPPLSPDENDVPMTPVAPVTLNMPPGSESSATPASAASTPVRTIVLQMPPASSSTPGSNVTERSPDVTTLQLPLSTPSETSGSTPQGGPVSLQMPIETPPVSPPQPLPVDPVVPVNVPATAPLLPPRRISPSSAPVSNLAPIPESSPQPVRSLNPELEEVKRTPVVPSSLATNKKPSPPKSVSIQESQNQIFPIPSRTSSIESKGSVESSVDVSALDTAMPLANDSFARVNEYRAQVSEGDEKKWPELKSLDSVFNMNGLKGKKDSKNPEKREKYWQSVAYRFFKFIRVVAVNSYVDLNSDEDRKATLNMDNAGDMMQNILRATRGSRAVEDLRSEMVDMFYMNKPEQEDENEQSAFDMPADPAEHILELLREYRDLLAVSAAQVQLLSEERWAENKGVVLVPLGIAEKEVVSRLGSVRQPSYPISTNAKEIATYNRTNTEIANNATRLRFLNEPNPTIPSWDRNTDEDHWIRQRGLGSANRSIFAQNLRDAVYCTIKLTPLVTQLNPSVRHNSKPIADAAYELIQTHALPLQVAATFPRQPLELSTDQVLDRLRLWLTSFQLINQYTNVPMEDPDAVATVRQVMQSLVTGNGGAQGVMRGAQETKGAPANQAQSSAAPSSSPASSSLSGAVVSASGGGGFLAGPPILVEHQPWRPLVYGACKAAMLFSASAIGTSTAAEEKQISGTFPRMNGSYEEYKQLVDQTERELESRLRTAKSRLESVKTALKALGAPNMDQKEITARVQRLEEMTRLIREIDPVQRLVVRELSGRIDAADDKKVRNAVKEILINADQTASLREQLGQLEDIRSSLGDAALDPAQFNNFLSKFGKNPKEAINHLSALKNQHDAMVAYGQLCASVTRKAVYHFGLLLQMAEEEMASLLDLVRNFYVKYASEDVAKEVNRISSRLMLMFTGNFQISGLNPDEMMKVRQRPSDIDGKPAQELVLIQELEALYRLASRTVVKRQYRQRWDREEQILGSVMTLDTVWRDIMQSLQTYTRDTVAIAEMLVVSPKKAREVVPFARVSQGVLESMDKLQIAQVAAFKQMSERMSKGISELTQQVANEARALARDVNDRIAYVIRINDAALFYSFVKENIDRNVPNSQMVAPPTLWVDLSKFFVDLIGAFNTGRPTPEIAELKNKLDTEIPLLKTKLLTTKADLESSQKQLKKRETQLIDVVKSHNLLVIGAQEAVSSIASRVVAVKTKKKLLTDSDEDLIVEAVANNSLIDRNAQPVEELPGTITMLVLSLPRFKQVSNVFIRLLTSLATHAAALEKKVSETELKGMVQKAIAPFEAAMSRGPPIDANAAAAMIASSGNVLGSKGQVAEVLAAVNEQADATNGGTKSRNGIGIRSLRLPGIAADTNRMGPTGNLGGGGRRGYGPYTRGPNVLDAAMDPNFVGRYDKPQLLKSNLVNPATARGEFYVKYDDLALFLTEVAGASYGYERHLFFVNPFSAQIVIPSAAFFNMLSYIDDLRTGERSNQEVITRMLATARDMWWIEEEYVPAAVGGVVRETPPSPSRLPRPLPIDSPDNQRRRSMSPQRMSLLEESPASESVRSGASSFRLKDNRGRDVGAQLRGGIVEDVDEIESKAASTPSNRGRRRNREQLRGVGAQEDDIEEFAERKLRVETEDERNADEKASRYSTPPMCRRVVFNPDIVLTPEEEKLRNGIEQIIRTIADEKVNIYGATQKMTVRELSLAVRKNFVNTMLQFMEFIAPLEQCRSVTEFDKILSHYITPQPLHAMRTGLTLIRMRGSQYSDVTMHEMMFSERIRFYFVNYIGREMSYIASMENSGYVQVHARQSIEKNRSEAKTALEKFTKRIRPYDWETSNTIVQDIP